MSDDADQPRIRTSIEKTMEVVELMAEQNGGAPLAALLVPMVKQKLPKDPVELDETLARHAQLLLLMRSDDAIPDYTMYPNPFEGETTDDPDQQPHPALTQG